MKQFHRISCHSLISCRRRRRWIILYGHSYVNTEPAERTEPTLCMRTNRKKNSKSVNDCSHNVSKRANKMNKKK